MSTPLEGEASVLLPIPLHTIFYEDQTYQLLYPNELYNALCNWNAAATGTRAGALLPGQVVAGNNSGAASGEKKH